MNRYLRINPLPFLSFAVLLLHITEGGKIPYVDSRGLLLERGFEVTSALGTTGLTTGLTPTPMPAGKCVTIQVGPENWPDHCL